MPADHRTTFYVFVAVFVLVTVLGFAANRWRRTTTMNDLQQWGLGGRSFGNWFTVFLVGGEIYTGYTLVAIPALVYTVGAFGFYAVPVAMAAFAMAYLFLARLWSVSYVHGFVTPAEFVKARFGSRGLSSTVALIGIVATVPFISMQLVGMRAVFRVMHVPERWALAVVFLILALYTFSSGLRAPALISVVKTALLVWTVLAAMLVVSMTAGSWSVIFQSAEAKFIETAPTTDGLILSDASTWSFTSLVLGSAMAMFLYPHALTGMMAARSRTVVKRTMAVLPVFGLMLGFLAMLGMVAIFFEIVPLGADATRNVPGDVGTILPQLFAMIFPEWCAGIAFAALGVGALVPASVMAISAANLFTRNIYREFIRTRASEAEQTWVSKSVSVGVVLVAVASIVALDNEFSVDLQTIGGVIILQVLPAVAIGLYSAWFHRWALVAGIGTGVLFGLFLLYQIPGRTLLGAAKPHFGGSAWKLQWWGLPTEQSIYVGVLALAANLVVATLLTAVLRALRVSPGRDITAPQHYVADAGDSTIRRGADHANEAPKRQPVPWGVQSR